MRVQAFQGLVPKPENAAQVASVPYDVVDGAEAAKLAEGNPLSFLHVIRPEIDLPPGTDLYSDAVYAKAAENFAQFQADGVLERESAPCVYVYRQTMGDHTQTGLALTCHIDDYENGVIRKHEKTRPDKENDRTRMVSELNANPGPVFLTYRENAEIDAAVQAVTESEPPVYDFVAPDCVGHTVWRVEGGEPFVRLFGQVPLAYVADGHHRSASAYRVGAERRAANPQHNGSESYNWFLTVLFPANQLNILAYNRAVASLNGLSEDEFLRKVGERFEIAETGQKVPETPGRVCMLLGNRWFTLSLVAGF